MNIVVDTNVVISGLFFGGYPRKVIESVVNNEFSAYASKPIIDEYLEIVDEMINNKGGGLNKNILMPFINKLNIINPSTTITICRDKDDDKFIECAVDSKSQYIISGDRDLLDIKNFKHLSIITASEFCNRFL